MAVEFEDISGTPRSLEQLVAALKFVEAEMITNPTRMGPRDTGPAVAHYMVIRDALRALIMASTPRTNHGQEEG